MAESAAVLLLAALAWLWLDGARTREVAVAAARRACEGEGLMLLDDTVALRRLRLRRRADGRAALHRVYDFEFSDTGDNRLDGSVLLLGHAVQAVELAPHRFAPGSMAP